MFTDFNKIYSLEIDLKNLEVVYNSKAVYANIDLDTSVMLLKLTLDAQPLNIDGKIINAYIKTNKDQNVTMQRCEILEVEEGIVGLDFKNSALKAGTNVFFLEIKSANGEIINSPLISYKVVEHFDIDNGIEGENDTTILRQLITEVEVAKTSVEALRNEIAAQESRRERAEADRKNNENTRTQAETSRVQAENSRVSKEVARQQAENSRVNSESLRVQVETTRVEAEKTRTSKETSRQQAEATRVQSENSRINSESLRVQAENIRTSKETSRQQAENSRVEAENSRVSKEVARVQAESVRESKENSRVNSESLRVQAETTRVSSEASRVQAENSRTQAEIKRGQAETTRVEAEKARELSYEKIKKDNSTFKEEMNESFGNAKTDYFGKEHLNVVDRLNSDFDNVHQRINDASYLEYSGSNIKADNSYYGYTKGLNVKGRTLQNLWNTDTNFTLQGYSSSKQSPSLLKPNTTYTLMANISESVFDYSLGMIYCIEYEGETTYHVFDTSSSASLSNGLKMMKVIIANKIPTAICIAIHSNNTVETRKATVNNVVLLEGDYTTTPLSEIPFIEGIAGVGDKKNLFDKNKELVLGAYFQTDGQINRSKFSETNQNFIDESYYEIKSNHLTWSGDNSYAMHPLGICFYTKEKQFIQRIEQTNMINIPIPSDAKYYRIKGDYSRINVLQLEENSKATIYEPHSEKYKIEIKSRGKNLLNPLISYPYDIHKNSKNDGALLSVVKVKPNTTYTMSVDKINTSGRVIAKFSNRLIHSTELYSASYSQGSLYNFLRDNYANGRKFEYTIYSGNKITFTTLNDCNYIYVNVDGAYGGNFNTGDFVTTINNVQIEEASTSTEYIPYVEDRIQILLDEPLRSLPNGVCDEILEDGTEIRRVGKIVLDGTEYWGAIGSGGHETRNTFEFTMNIKPIGIDHRIISCLCDKFTQEHTYTIPVNDNGFRIVHTEDINGSNYYILFCPSTNMIPYRDVDAWKKWLSQNPTTIYYELSEPIITKHNKNINLKTYTGTTHITSDNYLQPKISYKVPSNVQAVVSNLKEENEALNTQVSILNLENEAIKETNVTQDELINTTMMATDEMYLMLEPLLTNMLIDGETVNPLVNMYVAMVKRGLKTKEQVPEKYREQVKELIGQ